MCLTVANEGLIKILDQNLDSRKTIFCGEFVQKELNNYYNN